MTSSSITIVFVLITCLARILTPIPIVALALFSAVYLPDKRSAFIVFFGGLFISDLVLGLHSMIPVVYAGLVPVLLVGFGIKRRLRAPLIAGATAISSLVYFFLTNFGVWVLGGCDWTQAREYPLTVAGLVNAFSAGFPGMPEKMLVDLIAASLFFGAFPLVYKSLVGSFDLAPVWHKKNFG